MKVDRYLGTTKEQRKMARAVAKDVLANLKIYNIAKGSYCLIFGHNGEDIKTADISTIKECWVCARGAMFLSRARLFNEYQFPNPTHEAYTVLLATEKDFGNLNSRVIEAAFELDRSYVLDPYRETIGQSALLFGKRYKLPKSRLKAIMQNVLDNGGVFRPDKPKKATA